MKKIVLIIGVVSTVFTTSCKKEGFCKKGKDNVRTETRSVNDFNTVNSEGSLDVYITQDENLDAGLVLVEAPSDLIEYIKTDVNNGVLTIDHKKCFRGDNDIKIYVSSKEINDISLSGSGNIETENVLSPKDMRIELSGSGSIVSDLAVSSLYVKITGSGNLKSFGEAISQELKLTGSGNIEHFNLNSQNAKVKITGSGNIETDLDVESLNVEISGSGNIKSFGETSSQKLKITGSGNISNYGLTSKEATVKIDGSGDVEVYVTEKLDVNIDGSGNVHYKGNPSVTSDIDGSGDVKSDN